MSQLPFSVITKLNPLIPFGIFWLLLLASSVLIAFTLVFPCLFKVNVTHIFYLYFFHNLYTYSFLNFQIDSLHFGLLYMLFRNIHSLYFVSAINIHIHNYNKMHVIYNSMSLDLMYPKRVTLNSVCV